MALKSTWNDEESDGNQEDDNLVSNQVVFFGSLVSGNRVLGQERSGPVAIDTVCLSIILDIVATDSKTTSSSLCDFDSDCGDESEKEDESLQEAYEKMYTQWLKMCATNRALNSEVQELYNLKVKGEGKGVLLKALHVEKDENLKSVAIDLERTQKTLRLLNNRTSKLGHMIITGKSFGDHSGVGYRDESSSTKTVSIC